MLSLIKFLFRAILFFCLFLAVISLIGVANKIGWLNVALVFLVLVTYVIIYITLNDRKTKPKAEDKHYNEYMAKLNQEVQRPIIQAKLEKQENEPIDLGTIATGKVTWTSKEGKVKDLFNINVNLKIK